MKAPIARTILTLLALVTSIASWANAEVEVEEEAGRKFESIVLGPSNLGSSQAEAHKLLEHGNDVLTAMLDISSYELLYDYYNKVMTVTEQPGHVANQFFENSEGSV